MLRKPIKVTHSPIDMRKMFSAHVYTTTNRHLPSTSDEWETWFRRIKFNPKYIILGCCVKGIQTRVELHIVLIYRSHHCGIKTIYHYSNFNIWQTLYAPCKLHCWTRDCQFNYTFHFSSFQMAHIFKQMMFALVCSNYTSFKSNSIILAKCLKIMKTR